MMLRILTIAIVAALLVPTHGQAADIATGARHQVHAAKVPYPLSWRARKIRQADNCWRGCEAEAGRGFQACLRRHEARDCVQANDAADRYCLQTCRLYGGPLVDAD
jgi:hypothetical protein